VPAKAVLSMGLLLLAAGLLLLSRMPSDATYLARILPVFMMVGVGMGLSFVPLQIAAQSGVDESRAGLAAGLINTSQEVGGAIGVAVAATIAFRRVEELTAQAGGDAARVLAARTSVFHEAFLVGAGFALVALVIAITVMPRIPASDATPVSG